MLEKDIYHEKKPKLMLMTIGIFIWNSEYLSFKVRWFLNIANQHIVEHRSYGPAFNWSPPITDANS